jgi:hypothetical protein
VLVPLAAHLVPSGVLMLTVGDIASEAAGQVGDEPVFHASLAPENYTDILQGLGLKILEFVIQDPESDFQTVLLAKKSADLP